MQRNHIVKNLLQILFILLLVLQPKQTVDATPLLEPKDEYIIVIDPGHGGSNSGTTSNENFLEKDIIMKTARGLVDELSKYDGVKVILTRTGDEDLSLKERAVIAEKVHADFLFSLHYNASENHTMFGTEVWIPLNSPYHAPCYQFAYMQQLQMQELGLFSRGIKTRSNEAGANYYGIIRECVAREIPAVIIEHCYVDESRDIPYCDEDADYIEFGRRDAIAIAQFLGLEPYEDQTGLLDMTEKQLIDDTFMDDTKPDSCEITAEYYDEENGLLTITVTAKDKETPIMYYDYTTDGGVTFSKLHEWPGCDLLQGVYDEEFSLVLELRDTASQMIYVRAYNKFDLFRKSNVIIDLSKVAQKTAESTTPVEESEGTGGENVATDAVSTVPPIESDSETEQPAETTPESVEAVQEATSPVQDEATQTSGQVSEDTSHKTSDNQSLRSKVFVLFLIVWSGLLFAMGVVIYRFFIRKK